MQISDLKEIPPNAKITTTITYDAAQLKQPESAKPGVGFISAFFWAVFWFVAVWFILGGYRVLENF